ncbi:MAG: hypothetical protein C0623_03080 [Desulfuromonas sp.]|nr:MAG: hypothetical protein C0623_03080 [Desulfuromonas sp.]
MIPVRRYRPACSFIFLPVLSQLKEESSVVFTPICEEPFFCRPQLILIVNGSDQYLPEIQLNTSVVFVMQAKAVSKLRMYFCSDAKMLVR